MRSLRKASDRIVVCTALSLVSAVSSLPAGENLWTSTYPYGGLITPMGLALHPADSSDLLATPVGRGIYGSNDGAATWTNLTDELEDFPVDRFDTTQIYIGPSGAVFAVGGGTRQALARSLDRGKTWVIVDAFLAPDSTTTLVFDPSDSDTIMIGTAGGSVHTSDDLGDTWGSAGVGTAAEQVYSLEADPGTGGVFYLGGESNGIYKSTDWGATWSSSNNNVTMIKVGDIAVDPTNPLVVYAVDTWTTHGRLYKSADGGATWSWLPVTVNPIVDAGRMIAVDPTAPNTVYVLTDGGVQKSVDGGSNWDEYPIGDAPVSTIVLDTASSATLYAGSHGRGVLRSTDGGVTWATVNQGLSGLQPGRSSPHSLAFDRTDPNIVYSGNTFEGWRSTDGGTTWSSMNLATETSARIVTSPGAPGSVYAFQGYVQRSTDYGLNWQDWDNDGLCCFSEGDLVIHPTDPLTMFMAGHGSSSATDGIYKSVDGGNAWAHLAGSPTPIRTLGIDPNNGDVIFAGTPEPGGGASALYKTDDGGTIWTQLAGGLPSDFFANEVVVHPADSNLVYLGCEGLGGGVWRSVNGGATWDQILADNVTSVEIDPTDLGRVYVGTWDGSGFYRSFDGGASWQLVNWGLPHHPGIESVALDPIDPDRILINTSAWSSTVGSSP